MQELILSFAVLDLKLNTVMKHLLKLIKPTLYWLPILPLGIVFQ